MVKNFKKMKNWILKIINIIYSLKNNDYKEIEDDEYYSSFGLVKKNGEWKKDTNNDEKIKTAYNKAWDNRDFEINKFWSRAAYFWGFLVIIFGAYFTLSLNTKSNEFIQLLLICLGIIFSTAWHYVIRGSKRWQENWEKHIDKLEDFISGPLYKTIYHNNTFFSVSKINETLSFTIILVWLGLLYKFLNSGNYLLWNKNASNNLDTEIFLIILMTAIITISIVKGYSRKRYNNKKNKFIRRLQPKN